MILWYILCYGQERRNTVEGKGSPLVNVENDKENHK